MPRAQYFVGIDLHKTVLQICVMDAAGEIVEETRRDIATRQSGLKAVDRLSRWKPARLAVEALGVNRWFVRACRARGYDIVVVDAGRLNLRSQGKKTDRRDALEIARRLRLGDLDRYALTYFSTEEEHGARTLERLRHDLVERRTEMCNRLRALMDAYKLDAPVGDLYSRRALQTVRALVWPVPDLEFSRDVLCDAIQGLHEVIGRLSKRIDERARDPKVAALREMVPQVGPLTALTVVAELGDVSRFRNARAAASYGGLVPRVNNSAEQSHHGRITKRGNKELRWTLNQAAVRLLSHHPTVRRWAEPHLQRMHKNKVRTMLARRLLVGIYIVLSRGEVFSMKRCLGIS